MDVVTNQACQRHCYKHPACNPQINPRRAHCVILHMCSSARSLLSRLLVRTSININHSE